MVTEALRWSGGRRGEAVSSARMSGSDLTAFVAESLVIGAHAITAGGGTQDMFELERLVAIRPAADPDDRSSLSAAGSTGPTSG